MKNCTLHLILILCLMIPSFVYGQEDIDSLYLDMDLSEDSVDLPVFIDYFPIQASFPGGVDSLNAYLLRMITYPDSALALEISGMVYISFMVEEDGSISRVELLRGIGGGCDEVALEAIRSMPKWKPQMWEGKPQSSAMMIPVLFRLSE